MVDKIINGVETYGFICKGWIESPLKGAEGNTEFLACFTRKCMNDPEQSTANQWLLTMIDMILTICVFFEC